MFTKRPENLEPEDLARLGSLYDQAWAAVAANFADTDAATRTAARSRLAGIMLELLEQQLVSEGLKQRAVSVFQTAYTQAALEGGSPEPRT